MSIQEYVHQLRPRKESYVNHVDRIQSFLTESDTEGATRMEQAIVVGYNINKGMLTAQKLTFTIVNWLELVVLYRVWHNLKAYKQNQLNIR